MDTNFKFEIHPSVVIQLGEDLISDEIQAITELIKNSYDADSNYCKVTIDTQWEGVIDEEVQDEPFKGKIVIEDAGFGMDEESIRIGFLTISDSPKKKLKNERKTTPGGRTPLGDKGLGRLGVQRLGEYIEICT